MQLPAATAPAHRSQRTTLILKVLCHVQELPATVKQRFELAGIDRTEHKVEEPIKTRGAGAQG
jgi:hypothetical protein